MSFKAYDEYKDSGVEWLGEIPAKWKVLRNKNVLTKSCQIVGDSSSHQQLLSLTLKGILPRSLDGKGKYPTDFDSYQTVEKDDLVFCLFDIDETPRTVGHSMLSGMITGAYTVIKTKPGQSAKYTYYYYLQIDNRKGLRPFYTGLRKVVRPETFMNIEMPIPSWQEQTTIAAFLDHETARIDALIEEQQRLIDLLKEKRQAVISHAVTKGLDPNVPMKDSGVEWLGDVPAHWTIKRYRYATKIYRGKFGHRPRNDPAFYDGGYPFIQTGDIARAQKTIDSYSQTLNKKGISVSQKFPAGSLVMAIAANIGDTAILNFDAYAPDSVVAFEPRRDISLEFLRYSLDAALPALEKTSTQSTQANLNIDRIGSVEAIFPSLHEQIHIAQYIEHSLNQANILEQHIQEGVALLTERRSALISAAVTGKIDVRDWQPPKANQTAAEPAEASA